MRLVKFHDKSTNRPICTINPTQVTHIMPRDPDEQGRERTAIFLTDGEALYVPFAYGDTVTKFENAMRD